MAEKHYILSLIAGVLVIKLALFMVAGLSFDFSEQPHENWLTIWQRWDAKAYETIATHGYTPPATVAADYRAFLSHFPPVYPLLTRLVPGASFPVAATLISILSGVGASYFLYKLVRLDYSQSSATWSVLFFNLYPLAYFTLAPYAESLFLLLVIASFWWLRAKPEMSWAAGIALGASFLTRLMGIVAIPSLAIYIWQRIRSHKLSLSDVFMLFLPLWGLIVYLAINQAYFRHPLFFLQEYNANPYSSKAVVYPFKYTVGVLQQGFTRLQNGPPLDYDYFIHHGWNAIFTIVATLLIVWGAVKRLPFMYTIFSLTGLLFFNLFDWGISNARYTLSIWPIFLSLALLPRAVRYPLLILSTSLLIYFTRIFTSGWWAF